MSHNKHTYRGALTLTQPEWARVWESLAELTVGYTDHNPQSGEYWAYTGAFRKDRPAIGSLLPLRVLVHEFRHRNRCDSYRPIPGIAGHAGYVVLHVTTSVEYSGG